MALLLTGIIVMAAVYIGATFGALFPIVILLLVLAVAAMSSAANFISIIIVGGVFSYLAYLFYQYTTNENDKRDLIDRLISRNNESYWGIDEELHNGYRDMDLALELGSSLIGNPNKALEAFVVIETNKIILNFIEQHLKKYTLEELRSLRDKYELGCDSLKATSQVEKEQVKKHLKNWMKKSKRR